MRKKRHKYLELCKLPKEAGWVEFKHNNCEPTMIGEDITTIYEVYTSMGII